VLARYAIVVKLTAAAAWVGPPNLPPYDPGTKNITMSVSNPGTVTNGMGVFDLTSHHRIGRVASYTGTALVLVDFAEHPSAGSSDVLAFCTWVVAGV
jgi:hypothetical protein